MVEHKDLLSQNLLARLSGVDHTGDAIVGEYIRGDLAEDEVGGEKAKEAGCREGQSAFL